MKVMSVSIVICVNIVENVCNAPSDHNDLNARNGLNVL
jgi:hypothetical protein